MAMETISKLWDGRNGFDSDFYEWKVEWAEVCVFVCFCLCGGWLFCCIHIVHDMVVFVCVLEWCCVCECMIMVWRDVCLFVFVCVCLKLEYAELFWGRYWETNFQAP